MILDVLIEARLAGRLDLTRPEHPVFTYDTAYARDGDATPLSTLFPPAAAPPEGETLLSWLHGLLPDHDAVLASLCEEHDVPPAHPVLLLGCRVGRLPHRPAPPRRPLRGDRGARPPRGPGPHHQEARRLRLRVGHSVGGALSGAGRKCRGKYPYAIRPPVTLYPVTGSCSARCLRVRCRDVFDDEAPCVGARGSGVSYVPRLECDRG